jgi:hypothetical protein
VVLSDDDDVRFTSCISVSGHAARAIPVKNGHPSMKLEEGSIINISLNDGSKIGGGQYKGLEIDEGGLYLIQEVDNRAVKTEVTRILGIDILATSAARARTLRSAR